MPIDRERVRELKQGRDPGNAEAVRQAGELPWIEPATHLLKMWSAPTLEEFNRLAEGFPAALRRLRSIIVTQRQDPARHDGWHLRDRDLEANLQVLSVAVHRANYPDRFADPGGFPARQAMGQRLNGLFFRFKFGK